MSVGKPMSERTKKIVSHALVNGFQGTCEQIYETEEGTMFRIKIVTTKMILIPDR